eukprot:scaffold20417_cov172-Skeletonema_dohrnii-CCMP3373.AAC.1
MIEWLQESAPNCFFSRGKKLTIDRIWPEQQKSPTSTSSNFNLLHQTHHNAILYHIIPNQPQEAAIATSSSTERAHHHRSSFSAVGLLLDWARQDISSAIRVNSIGTSELIRSSSQIKAPCHHQPMKISTHNILTSLRRRPLDAMAMYLLCRSLTIPWKSRFMSSSARSRH